MRLDDNAVGQDHDEFDGEGATAFGLGAETELEPNAESDAKADAIGQAVLEAPGAESDLGIDEELLEAELGAFDAPVFEDDLDEELLEAELADQESDDDEDDLEMILLQELGIDLDAPDEVETSLDLAMTMSFGGTGGDDDTIDDEMAA